MSEPSRVVHCADAIEWLATAGELKGCSVITSLPDVSELPALGFEGWKTWFVAAARKVLDAVPEEGVAIFFQSDIKTDRVWVDKGALVLRAAIDSGHQQLWHKVVLRKPAGAVCYGRAGYSHLLAFSKGVKLELSRATADVLPDAGPSPWTRGMGVRACEEACRFVLSHTSTRTVVDPFCGRGTVLAVANSLGLNAVGVEIASKRARQARSFVLGELERSRSGA